jgi:hypothetical protein
MAVVRWYPSVSPSTATPAAARGASSARDKAESSVLQEVGMTCTRRDRPPSLGDLLMDLGVLQEVWWT